MKAIAINTRHHCRLMPWFLVAFFLVANPGFAQERVALVIGNSKYVPPLRNPSNDAKAIADALRTIGFQVIEGHDLSAEDMLRRLADFKTAGANAQVSLFFYAGHGFQIGGNNYLLPVGVQIEDEIGAKARAISLESVLSVLEESGAFLRLAILDSCRDDPFERSWKSRSLGKGLAALNGPDGTIIAFATAPGKTAADGNTDHSPYTAALLKHLTVPGKDVIDVFRDTAREVNLSSNKTQVPWLNMSFTERYTLVPRAAGQEPDEPSSIPMIEGGGALAAQGHYDRGVGLLNELRLKEAVVEFDQAIAKDAGKVDYWRNRLLANMHLDRLDNAFQDAKALVAMEPEQPAWKGMIALVMLARGQFAEAFQEIGEYNPNEPDNSWNGMLREYARLRLSAAQGNNDQMQLAVGRIQNYAIQDKTMLQSLSKQTLTLARVDSLSVGLVLIRLVWILEAQPDLVRDPLFVAANFSTAVFCDRAAMRGGIQDLTADQLRGFAWNYYQLYLNQTNSQGEHAAEAIDALQRLGGGVAPPPAPGKQ